MLSRVSVSFFSSFPFRRIWLVATASHRPIHPPLPNTRRSRRTASRAPLSTSTSPHHPQPRGPAVGRREPPPSAAVSPHRRSPRATAVRYPWSSPGPPVAQLDFEMPPTSTLAWSSPCSPLAWSSPCCPDGHGCARGFNVPAGGGRGHNFLPVMGRGRGHEHRVCLAGAGL
jgi:hypothetical protein